MNSLIIIILESKEQKVLEEIENRSQVEDVLRSQNHILEMIASGLPFSEVLENIIQKKKILDFIFL